MLVYFSNRFLIMEYKTNEEIAKLFDIKENNVRTYARNYNVNSIGEGTRKIYLWTPEDIEKYKEYLEKIKIKRNYPVHKSLSETVNLDTLYHRLIRARKANNKELEEQTLQLIENARKEKKVQKEKE